MRTTSAGLSMRSGEVARAAGVNQQTLRYYERRGLLDEPDRSPGGHRRYSPDAVAVLRVIRAAQRLGFTLAEVADLIQVGCHRHRRADAGLQHHVAAKLAEVEARIEDLCVIRDTLVRAMAAGCDDLVGCAGSECCPLPFTELALPPNAESGRVGESVRNGQADPLSRSAGPSSVSSSRPLRVPSPQRCLSHSRNSSLSRRRRR